MKNLLFILLLAPTIAMVSPQDSISNISKAISSGNVEALSDYFDDNIEVAVLDEEDFYKKTEAKHVIKSFFTKNQPKSFSQVHQGRSKGQDSQYMIGNLKATSGTFRVYLYMSVESGKYRIQELRFDKS